MNQSIQQDSSRNMSVPVPQYYEDEISLIDLWLTLVRHKKVFWAVLAVCVVIGLIYSAFIPVKYNYSTSIEIGTRVQNEVITSIEDPQTVLAKIQESYVPLVVNEFIKSDPNKNNDVDINVRVPKGSQIIVLESKGAEENAETHLQLQQQVVDKIRHDHQRIIDIIRKEVEIEKKKAVNKLSGFKDAALLIKAKEKRVYDLEQLLKQRLEATDKELTKTISTRQRAVKEATTEAKAMTLLLLDSEIDKQRERKADLQERLKVEIADKKDEFVKLLSDNRREQSNQSGQVSRLETQLANLRETSAIVPPMQSNKPVGISTRIIIILVLVVSAMLGLLAAFFTEFLVKAREQAQLQSNP